MLSLAGELRAARLRYEADKTLQFSSPERRPAAGENPLDTPELGRTLKWGFSLQNVAHLHIAAGRLTRFAPVAELLGSDHWVPIVALAQAAIKRGRDDIARDVFAAADQPGLQRDYLRQQCIELTGAPPVPIRPRSR